MAFRTEPVSIRNRHGIVLVAIVSLRELALIMIAKSGRFM